MLELSFHHVAITVRDLDAVLPFYERLGFARLLQWRAEDGSMHLVLLRRGEMVMEFFQHPGAAAHGNTRDNLEDDIRVPGIRHFAFSVPDLDEAIASLETMGIRPSVPSRTGRTGMKIAFIRDPEGNWIELVENRH